MNYLQVYGAVIKSAVFIFIDDCPVLIACSNIKIYLVMHLKQNAVLSNYVVFECVDINVL